MPSTFFTDPWQPKEVLDPDVESGANNSIVEMVFGYGLPDICQIIMTNYTWKDADIQKVYPFYGSLGMNEQLSTLQQNCEKSAFEELTRKFGDSKLPLYSKGVDSERVANASRVYHDARTYLDTGSAEKEELSSFVSSILKEVLEPLFRSKEVKNVVKPLMESLLESEKRDEEIGVDIEKSRKYVLAESLQESDPEFPGFHDKLPSSITNFLGYFALHTIRHHCFASFGVDGQLKIYQREMYRKALEELRVAKKTVVGIKSEKLTKSVDKRETKRKAVVVKSEQKESDDDFCEIIDPMPVKKQRIRKTSERNETDSNSEDSLMVARLNKTDLPIEFKTYLLNLLEENQRLRAEIEDNRELFLVKMAEKKSLIK